MIMERAADQPLGLRADKIEAGVGPRQWAVQQRRRGAGVPLDDLCDLSFPVCHGLLLGCQILQLVLQLSVLGREFIHKGTKLKLNSPTTAPVNQHPLTTAALPKLDVLLEILDVFFSHWGFSPD